MSQTIRFEDGDIQISSSGGQEWIGAAEKAAQDLLCELLTPYSLEYDRGDEMFDPDGRLTTIAGSVVTGTASVRSYLRAAVGRLMTRQRTSSRISRAEVIQAVKDIAVVADRNDPTAYLWNVVVAVDDELIGLAREIKMRHVGFSPNSSVGGTDR